MEIIGGSLFGIDVGSVLKPLIKFGKKVYGKPPERGPITLHHRDLDHLNNLFEGEAEIIRFIAEQPRLAHVAELKLSSNLHSLAVKYREEILPFQKKQNEPHAVLCEEPIWVNEPIHLKFKRTDYASICALRDVGEKPKILSGGALIFCSEKREIYLHQRSEKTDTFKRRLHIFGGNYIPPHWVHDDEYSLIRTAKREIVEETSLGLTWSKETPMVMGREIETGFIQFVLLGVDIPTDDTETLLRKNWEGEVVKLSFDRLEEFLLSDNINWVPSGKLFVLAWLAAGAPNLGPRARFGCRSARNLYEFATNYKRSLLSRLGLHR